MLLCCPGYARTKNVLAIADPTDAPTLYQLSGQDPRDVRQVRAPKMCRPIKTSLSQRKPELSIGASAAPVGSGPVRPQTPGKAGRLRAKRVRGGSVRVRATALAQRNRVWWAWRG